MLTKLDSLLSNASQTSVLGTNSPNRVIFLDDNLYYASMRLEVYKIAWNYSADVVAIFLNTPLSKCLENNLKRPESQIVPEGVIERMASRFEKPGEWWESATITLEGTEDPERVWESVVEMRSEADKVGKEWERKAEERRVEEEEKARSRLVTASSFFHALDLALRKSVGSAISHVKSSIPRAAKEMNVASKAYFNEVKKMVSDGSVEVPEVEQFEVVISGLVARFQGERLRQIVAASAAW